MDQIRVMNELAESLRQRQCWPDALPLARWSDKEVVRNAISELKLPKGSSAVLLVHFASPQNRNNIQEQLPQTKKDSEFQRGAVDFLKSHGFERAAT